MPTEKQIAANQANARKSTGPKSPEGKAKSRLNALRDGLTGQITTLPEADRLVFEKLRSELVASFNPQTPLETRLAGSIAWDTWRLDRLRAVEMNLFAQRLEESLAESDSPEAPDDFESAASDTRTFCAEAPRIDILGLYEQRINRGMHRNIALLRDLQAERKRNYQKDKAEEVAIARLHEFNDMPIQPSASPSRNGFVFSSEEIAVAAVHQRYLDTALNLLKNTKPYNLHGSLGVGFGDSLLEKVADKRPLSAEERREIHKTPPEVRAIERLNDPEAFGVHKQ